MKTRICCRPEALKTAIEVYNTNDGHPIRIVSIEQKYDSEHGFVTVEHHEVKSLFWLGAQYASELLIN